MTDQTIPNDDLGKWGESQFSALCAAGGLVASKAERDKMGWDFIVELPPEAANPTLPLDHRPNALGCRVQIKTHWQREDDRVEMTLSAAQRLALDPGPAFVLVLTADASIGDGDPKLVDCHLIHMLDKNLERLLERLRKNAAEPGDKPLNDQKITYSPGNAGQQLPLNGKALRDALIRVCGTDLQAYIAEKRDQLRNLGYTTGRYQLKTTITANSPDEFVEMVLGLRPLSVESLATYDVRFGLPVPVNDIPDGASYELQYTPSPLAKCTIRVRGIGFRPPAVFRGDVFLPGAQVPVQFMRMLIKASFFTLDARSSGEVNFNLDGKSLFEGKLSLEDWQQYLRLLTLLGEEELEIDVEPDDPKWPHKAFKLKLATPLPQEPWFTTFAEVARRGDALLKLAGAKGKETTLDELLDARERIVSAHAYLCGVAPARAFQSTGPLPPGSSIAEVELLYAECVAIAGVGLAYACRLTMRPETVSSGLIWRQIEAKPERLIVFDGSEEKFAAFVAETKEQTGLLNTIVRSVGVNSDDSVGNATASSGN